MLTNCKDKFQSWYLKTKGYTVFSFDIESVEVKDASDLSSCFWSNEYCDGIDCVSKDINNLRLSFSQLRGKFL